MSMSQQLFALFIISLPVASICRTVIFEEILREAHEWCVNRSKSCSHWYKRKFFYLFTCEYCFSHYVTLAMLFLTRFRLLYDDWRGYVMAFFSIVFVANVYLNLYSRMRLEISKDKAVTRKIEESNGTAIVSHEGKDAVLLK